MVTFFKCLLRKLLRISSKMFSSRLMTALMRGLKIANMTYQVHVVTTARSVIIEAIIVYI